MLIALYSGMRKSEILRLTWTDIDFDKGFIHIRNPKGVKDQIIPLNETVRTVLKSHPQGDSGFIFPGKHGKQRVNVYWHIKKIKAAAELPKDFRPLHGLRHASPDMDDFEPHNLMKSSTVFIRHMAAETCLSLRLIGI